MEPSNFFATSLRCQPSSPLKKSYSARYFSEDSFDDDVQLHRMSMKKKKKSRQETLWIPHDAVASSPGVVYHFNP